MMTEIRPRIDKTGVGWCHETCPQFSRSTFEQYNPSFCKLGHGPLLGECCPEHARRVAECLRDLATSGEEFRDGRYVTIQVEEKVLERALEYAGR